MKRCWFATLRLLCVVAWPALALGQDPITLADVPEGLPLISADDPRL